MGGGKVKKLGLWSLLLLSNIALAALPPTAESMRRIKAVMDSKEVYDKLGSVNWIKSITETKDGYVLQSDKCSLQVKVENLPQTEPHLIGPLPLTVKVGAMHCQ
jgi:hypothetical protein